MNGQVRVRTIRSVAEIEEVRSLWTSWQTHPNCDIDFYLTILPFRPEVIQPHVLVLYQNHQPKSLLIGRLENVRVPFKVGYSSFGRFRARQLTFIRCGLIGDSGSDSCNALLNEVLRSLAKGAADMAFFSHMTIGSPLFEVTTKCPRHRLQDYSSRIHRSMTVPATIDQLYERFSPKVRSELRRKARKLLKDFPDGVGVRTFTASDDLELMFRDIEEVARRTYQRGLHVGFENTPEMRSRIRLAVEKRWLRAYVLYIYERPCAFWVGEVYQGVFHGTFIGYDNTFAKHSPGTFLMMKAIEGFCELRGKDRIREIDWGLGDAQYKEILSDRDWKDASVWFFAPTWGGRWLHLTLTTSAIVNMLGRRFVTEVGLLQKVKTMWRKRLAHE